MVAEMPIPAIEALRHNPNVMFVAEDMRVDAFESADGAPMESYSGVSWALDRLDQRETPLSGTPPLRYFDGDNVDVFILDSGITDHTEFGNRVRSGWTYDGQRPPTDDCTGHGTWAASAAAGATVGVATAAWIWSVRVTGCGSPWLWDLIAGVDFVRGFAQRPAVANMSWSIPKWQDDLYWGSLEQAAKDLIQSGVTVVASAGNTNDDACGKVPARISQALTVGAIRPRD